MPKKTIEQEINEFLEIWNWKQMVAFLRDIIPLFELYDIKDEDDWVQKEVGGTMENVQVIRLIRTVYLVSKICEFHAGKICMLNVHFKNLWQRMEKQKMHKIDQNQP